MLGKFLGLPPQRSGSDASANGKRTDWNSSGGEDASMSLFVGVDIGGTNGSILERSWIYV